ncbi:MAG TPA: RnfABCDGE type electron transport complex subunit A [Atribacteraceae bacterium]|nr:RnfABCDGE type electron transport complex subunit A [Atribacteraceae bacterium]
MSDGLVTILKIFIGAVFVDNIVLARYIGLCPFIGMSSSVSNGLGMGMSVTFVMVLASLVTWTLWRFLLVPFELEYMRIMVFILVIASLVQLVEIMLRKSLPNLYKAMGIYLPLITTNCAILAVTFLGVDYQYSAAQVVVYSISVALGFTLALVLLAGIRERIRFTRTPAFFQGYPVVFITVSLLALALLGFRGLVR